MHNLNTDLKTNNNNIVLNNCIIPFDFLFANGTP